MVGTQLVLTQLAYIGVVHKGGGKGVDDLLGNKTGSENMAECDKYSRVSRKLSSRILAGTLSP